jgi:hypothetical protein
METKVYLVIHTLFWYLVQTRRLIYKLVFDHRPLADSCRATNKDAPKMFDFYMY